MRLPRARGVLSASVVRVLSGRADDPAATLLRLETLAPAADPLGEDLQLALWTMYELHYQGFDAVSPCWEWDPRLLGARAALEAPFEDRLRELTRGPVAEALAAPGDVTDRLLHLVEAVEGPSMARRIQREASREQLEELLVQRSVYHLKESDPSSFVIPRLQGIPQARLVELQYDEYGAGRPDRRHATLFGDALEAAGLDRRYGAYLDVVPDHVLVLNNAMTLVGLHRRLRGAAMGHLAAFETTSSLPCRRFAMGIRRLGLPETVADYFDEHIEADAVHEQLALRDICGRLVHDEPELEADVLFGAAVCLVVEALGSAATLEAWDAGGSALVRPAPEAVA